MKVLIVPKRDVSFYYLKKNFLNIPNIFKPEWRNYLFNSFTSYEYAYYSDINQLPNIDLFMLGDLHKKHTSKPDKNTTNPSGHNCPKVKSISLTEVYKNIDTFNCIIFSIDSIELMKDLRQNCIKKKIFTVIIDHPDHESIYQNFSTTNLTYGLKYNIDFNLYFKKDIPLNIKFDWLKPIAPDPVRIESFNEVNISMSDKKYNFFFSGILHKSTTFENRDILLKFFKNIEKSNINIIDVKDHYKKKVKSNEDLEKEMSFSKFILAAPGRSWTTTRLVNSIFFNLIPVVSEPNCEVHDLNLKDMDNCITYQNLLNCDDTKRRKIVYNLYEKIKPLLNNFEMLEKISKNWKKEIVSNHTTIKKAQYIIKNISQRL